MQPSSCALYLHRAPERDTHTGKRDGSGRREDKLDRFTKNKDSKLLKISVFQLRSRSFSTGSKKYVSDVNEWILTCYITLLYKI